MIGASTGVSIGALFAGGLLPAVVCTVVLGIIVYLRSPKSEVKLTRPPAKEIFNVFLVALPALALPIVIRTAVVEGVATATEVSMVEVLYSLVVGVIYYRQLAWKDLYPILVGTVSLTGAVMLILGLAIAMSWALTQSGFARQLVAAMVAMPGGAISFLIASILGFIVLGSVLEGLPAVCSFLHRCCSRRLAPSASTTCTTRWSSSSPWDSACSRRRSASATTPRARSRACRPTPPC